MTILYEWIEEPIALWIPIALLIIGVLSIVGLFIASRYDIRESFFALLVAGVLYGFALGFVFLFDSLTNDPVKKVRATVNDTIPFVATLAEKLDWIRFETVCSLNQQVMLLGKSREANWYVTIIMVSTLASWKKRTQS